MIMMMVMMMYVCTIAGHDSLAEADKWKRMYKELEKANGSLGKQLSTSNYDHSVALDRMQEEMMKLRNEKEELLMVNSDMDMMRNELRAYQSINNTIIGVMTLISKIRLPLLNSNSSSSNDRSSSSGSYYISSSSSSSLFPSSSSSSSSPLSKLPSSNSHHHRKSEFDTLLQSIHRMISSTIDMNAIKFSSSSSSSPSSSTFITSTPTSGSISTLLQSLVLFLDDLSTQYTSYQELINQMTTTNISHIQTLEKELNSYQDEMIDIRSSVDRFNHQLRESGIVVDIKSSSSSSSSSNTSPIRVKVTRFDEGGWVI